jgi:hypothetical protein
VFFQNNNLLRNLFNVLIFVILSMDGEHFVSDMMTLQVRRIVRNSKIDAKC